MKKIKKLLSQKRVWLPLSLIAAVGIGVLGTCQAGYCKAENSEKNEAVVYTHPGFEDSFEGDPFFADVHNHFRHVWNAFDRAFPRVTVVQRVRSPRVDMIEKEKSVEIQAEFPGLNKEDISVSIQDKYLTLETQSKKETKKTEKNYHLQERSYGESKRVLRLPHYVDSTKATSSFNNGVLTVSIPKKPKSEIAPKKIMIK